METAKKISIAGSNKRDSPRELAKNETAKSLPFSLFLNFETAENILLTITNQCYETVQTIIASFDFHLNKTDVLETPKDVSNLIVYNHSKISLLEKMNLYVI